MEGTGGELINIDNKTVNEEREVQKLREVNAALENRLQCEGDDVEPEVKLEIVERKAEEIIPKECWGIVFRKLEEKDWLSCRLVCKTFNQILDLKEFKMKWKFKLILPLVFPYLKTNDFERRPWKHLYNLRLVCRSWHRAIDKYTSEVYGTESFSPLHLPLLTAFRNSEDIQEFQEEFGECTGNPFPSRSVEITNPADELEEEEEGVDVDWLDAMQQFHDTYFGNVDQLLEQFGRHIFRLRLQFEYDWPDPYPMTLCKLIKTITIHLPNLKELSIHCMGNLEDDEEGAQRVTAYIAENPIEASVLPKLRVLRISCLDFDKKIENYLLDAFGPQLVQLEAPLPINLQRTQFEKLRKLWLNNVREPSETLESLESLRFLQSPLGLLKLKYFFWTAPEIWNMDKALRNLKHLPIELLEISLAVWVGARGRMNLAEAGLDIEEYKNTSIKTLILHIHRKTNVDDRISFNFLPAMTKLENLEFKFSRQLRTTHPQEFAEVVKLNEYLFGEEGVGGIYQSNVWEKVPSLKTFTSSTVDTRGRVVNKSICTREELERIRTSAEGGVLELNQS